MYICRVTYIYLYVSIYLLRERMGKDCFTQLSRLKVPRFVVCRLETQKSRWCSSSLSKGLRTLRAAGVCYS